MSNRDTLTLLELNRRIGRLVTDPSTQQIWVTAELSDVSVRGGHCYMELLQKDTAGVNTVARARAVIWANVFIGLRSRFYAATGRDFSSGIKVMVLASANYHPVYGLSLVISDLNPDYTMGDLLRRRREILARLEAEGILNCNRELPWPDVPWRVAVISAPGAAGYGDFINQLYSNPRLLRFSTRLYHAVMQGEKAPRSIIAALEEIAMECDDWDCVVIIRGGGARSDLIAFEDYELAAAVAQFPIPVIVGIGHERDVTVLDYVANMRVKTPTAAAEWLIARGADVLDSLLSKAHAIHRAVAERIAAEGKRIAYCEGLLPVAPTGAIDRAKSRLNNSLLALSQISSRRISPEQSRLSGIAASIPKIAEGILARESDRLEAKKKLVEVLSPQATLRRGYSITRFNGHALTAASQVNPGDTVTTILADGTFTSIVEKSIKTS